PLRPHRSSPTRARRGKWLPVLRRGRPLAAATDPAPAGSGPVPATHRAGTGRPAGGDGGAAHTPGTAAPGRRTTAAAYRRGTDHTHPAREEATHHGPRDVRRLRPHPVRAGSHPPVGPAGLDDRRRLVAFPVRGGEA